MAAREGRARCQRAGHFICGRWSPRPRRAGWSFVRLAPRHWAIRGGISWCWLMRANAVTGCGIARSATPASAKTARVSPTLLRRALDIDGEGSSDKKLAHENVRVSAADLRAPI